MKLGCLVNGVGVLLVSSCGLFDPGEPSSSDSVVEGPYGLEGLSGSLDGAEVFAPQTGHAAIGDYDGTLEFLPFLPDDGYALIHTGEPVWGMATYTVNLRLGLILMPEEQPLAQHWLCAGEGSTLSYHEDEVYEADLINITDMGSCEGAPDGDYFIHYLESFNDRSVFEWDASPELLLDTLYVEEANGERRTENGRVIKYIPYSHVDEYEVAFDVEGGAVLIPNPEGELFVACPGSGSTITFHEEMTPDGAEYIEETKLENVSIVGQCPGTAVGGSLKVIKGQTNLDD